MTSKILPFLCLILLIGCKKSEPERFIDFTASNDFRIVNVWNEENFKRLQENKSVQISPDAISEESFVHYSYLSLKPNHEYTFLIGNKFMYGTYVLINPQEIELQSEEFGKIPMKIIASEGDAIQIVGDFKNFKSDMMVEIDGNTIYYLNLKNDLEKLNKTNDIRSVSFNQWRFKPTQAESVEEIQHRLIENLNYISAYMRVHAFGNFDGIHTNGMYSPFSHAKNALILLDWDRVSNFWKHTFYDDKDALKAYFMLKRAFEETTPPDYIDDWLLYNEKCLEEIIKTLENKQQKTQSL